MSMGTKNRQKQTADICKQHLLEKYPDKLGLVEEFIVEIEGPPKNSDVTRWGQFTDALAEITSSETFVSKMAPLRLQRSVAVPPFGAARRGWRSRGKCEQAEDRGVSRSKAFCLEPLGRTTFEERSAAGARAGAALWTSSGEWRRLLPDSSERGAVGLAGIARLREIWSECLQTEQSVGKRA